MKRKFAVIMSAALAAGSTMPVMAESETAFTPSTYVGEFSLTADGESMLFSVTAEQFAEDGVSVSANVTLPASVTGEEADTVYGLNDVLRVVSGDLYINVAEIASTYGELLGSDISSMLPMFGIDQDWVEIPAIDFAAVETEAETDFDVDSMMNDLTALAENFDIQTAEDGSTTITFDGPAIVNTVKAVENVVDNAMSVLLSQVQGTDASQLVTVFDDYVQPNLVVESGEFDANYFQHIPYLDDFNAEQGTHLVNAGGIHYEPFGIYPGTKSSLDDLADGDVIAVPNDTTNEARALLLLEANGVITLKDGAGLAATVNDIAENPKNVEIKELEAAQVSRVKDEVAFVVLNGNYALQAGFSVAKDSIAYETSDSEAAKTYVNVIAVKEGNENNDAIKALVDVLKSDEIKQFINDKYDGAVIPFEE